MSDKNTSQSEQRLAKPQCKVAVVAEGGGQRGIFTAGVLDAFLAQQFNPFEIGLGVSAGAQNLLSYFMGEQGYARRAIAELTAAPGFFVPYRWLGARGVIDLDNYFDTTLHDPEYRLPYQRISAVQKNRQLIFVASNRENLQPVYLEPDASNVVHYLKASSAVPFLYKAPVEVQQQCLVDGGIADPLPVKRAIELGAKRIVVIRTANDQTPHSSWRQRIDALRLRKALPATLNNMLDVHEAAYAQALEIIHTPPAGVTILHVAPEEALQSHAFGSSSESIVHDYETGLQHGARAVDTLRNWLPKQNRINLRKLTDSETESAST